MNFVSEHAFDSALSAHRLQAPSTARASTEARAQLGQVAFKLARRLIDMLRIVSVQKTLQPEHVHNLSRLALLLSTPAGATGAAEESRTRPLLMRGGFDGAQGHTVMAGSFFNPADQADASSYTAANVSAHTESFPEYPGAGGVVRFALDSSPAFPVSQSGGASSAGWLSDDAVQAIVREYKARAGAPDLRVSEGAKALIKRVLQSNLASVLRAASRGASSAASKASKTSKATTKSKQAPTAAAIAKASKGWIIQW